MLLNFSYSVEVFVTLFFFYLNHVFLWSFIFSNCVQYIYRDYPRWRVCDQRDIFFRLTQFSFSCLEFIFTVWSYIIAS